MASKRAGQVRANLADWSGDAQVEDGANEQKHALTSKSIRYDVWKIKVLSRFLRLLFSYNLLNLTIKPIML